MSMGWDEPDDATFGFTPAGAAVRAMLSYTIDKVWSGSLKKGSFERSYWRYHSYAAGRRLLRAAERFNRESKKLGHKHGALRASGLVVLELLINTQRKYRGRLEPEVGWIAEKTGYHRATVHRALNLLRRYRFLSWERRYIEVWLPGEDGPRKEQVSSAYRLAMPAIAEVLVPPKLRPRPAKPAVSEAPHTRQGCAKSLADLIATIQSPGTQASLLAMLAKRVGAGSQ